MDKAEQDKLVEKWKGRFESSRSAQQPLFDAAKRWYDAFYAVYTKKAAPWRSKIIDPKIANYTLNYLYKVALTDPEPNLIPHDKHDFVKAKTNEDLLNYQLANPLFDQPMFFRRFSALCDGAVAGTGYFLNLWEAKEMEFKTRRMKDGKVSLSEERVITKKLGYNNPVPLSFFRVFFEPGAESAQQSLYSVYLDYKSPKEVKDLAKNKSGYMNLDVLDEEEGEGENNSRYYETSRNKLLSLANNKKYRKEIRVCYDSEEKKFYHFINDGTVLIYVEDNIFWHQQNPITPVYIRPRAFSVFGDGLFERNERLGAANDDVTNHFFEQLQLSLNGLTMHNENTVITRQDVRPGGEIIYTGMEKPDMVAVPQPDLAGYQIAKQSLAQSIEEGTMSGYDTGNPSAATDKTKGTRGGIEAIQEASSTKIQFADKTYGTCCAMQFFQMMMNNQQLLDYETSIRVLGPNGWVPKVVTPEDVIMVGTADIQVSFDTTVSQGKQAQLSRMVAYVDKQLEIAAMAAKLGKPLNVNFYELSSQYAEGLSIKKFDRIIEPMPEANDTPESENELFLMGKSFDPSEGEDHKTHIVCHQELLDDTGVDKEIQDTVKAHITAHRILLAEEAKQRALQASQAPTMNQLSNSPGNVSLPLSEIQGQQPAAPGQAGMAGANPLQAQPIPATGGGSPLGGIQAGG